MLWVLYAIAKKFNLGNAFKKSVDDVASEIEKSVNEKEKAEKLRDEAQQILDNLPIDIENIEKVSSQKTEAFKSKIEENVQKTVFNIDAGVKKSLEIEEKKISNRITEATSTDAVNLAKLHIIKTLEANPELHNKYILESLDELDKVKL